MDIWLRTDEEQEAVFWLQQVLEQLMAVRTDLYKWKWVILALHGSVQGFMTLALRSTDSRHVLDRKSEKAWVAWTEDPSTDSPEDFRLDRFLALYEKVKSERMLQWHDSVVFMPGQTHDFSMKTLNALRNELIHFVPAGYSLEVSGLPQITRDCIDLIRFLGFSSGNLRWNSEVLRRRTKLWILVVEHEAKEIGAAYDRGEYPRTILEELDAEMGLTGE